MSRIDFQIRTADWFPRWEDTMRNHHIVLVLIFALGMLGADRRASAGDFCIDEGGGTWVGKGFRLPKPGQCRSWNGFLLTTFAPVAIGSGTGCTSSDGTTFRLRISSARETIAFVDYLTLPLPDLSGGTLQEWEIGQSTFPPSFTFSALNVVPCPTKSVTVP